MPEYAIIVAGQVTNVIVASEGFALVNFPNAIRIDTLNPVPGIGWRYQDGVFSQPGY